MFITCNSVSKKIDVFNIKLIFFVWLLAGNIMIGEKGIVFLLVAKRSES